MPLRVLLFVHRVGVVSVYVNVLLSVGVIRMALIYALVGHSHYGGEILMLGLVYLFQVGV